MDPYQTLGVSKEASKEEIQKAYRKLAKELHPDLHPGDKQAEDRFKAVSSAYGLLKDPETRARYDRGEIDEHGVERPSHNFYRDHADGGSGRYYHSSAGFDDFADLSDLFGSAFGRGGAEFRARGGDVRYALDVEFMDAVKGAKRQITLPDGNSLNLTIPPGTRDGQVLRLKGKGMAGFGKDAPPGDALIEISVRDHPVFSRQGNDIQIDLPVSIDEAILGAQIHVPTLTGKVRMTIPAGVQNGERLRLKGRGLPSGVASDKAGDQFVRIVITLPETIDPDLAEAMRSWRTAHGYNPRAKMERETV